MKRLFASLALMVLLLLPATPVVAAYNPVGDACSLESSAAACNASTTDPINSTIRKATQIVSVIAGVVAVILAIVAGLQYVTSDGDSSKISSAKSALIGAIVGLVIVAIAQGIIKFVLNKVVS